jgi:hypothetical protein
MSGYRRGLVYEHKVCPNDMIDHIFNAEKQKTASSLKQL